MEVMLVRRAHGHTLRGIGAACAEMNLLLFRVRDVLHMHRTFMDGSAGSWCETDKECSRRLK